MLNMRLLIILNGLKLISLSGIIGSFETLDNSTRLKRDLSCVPDAEINDCPSKYPMYIMMSYEFTADVKPGCMDSWISFDWEINSMESDDGRPLKGHQEVFIIPEFSFISGKHEVILRITEVNGENAQIEIFKCYIHIELEDPIPIIKGGIERTVVPNLVYTVDGSESINFRHEHFEPIWSVDCTKHSECSPPTNFACPSPSKDDGLKWSFNTQTCYNYSISLSLKQKDSDETPPFVQKLHTVMDKDVETSHFQCEDNCNSIGYLLIQTEQAAVFKVVCDSNCDQKTPTYQFEYNDEEAGISSAVQPSRDFETSRLVQINRRTLETNKEYIFQGDISDRKRYKESIKHNLKTYKPIELACTVTPKDGIAFETNFKFDCSGTTPEDYVFTYEIYQPDMEGVFAMSSSFPVFETKLAVSDGIAIGVTYGRTMYKKWKKYKDIQVRAAKDMNIDESLELLRKIVQFNKAFEVNQLAYTILTELSKDLEEKEKFQVQSLVLEELFKFTIDNPIAYSIMGRMVNTLLREPFTVAYAKRLKRFCKKVSKASRVVKFDRRFQQARLADPRIESVMRCREENLENQATLSSDNDITTPSEGILMEDQDLIVENYPYYDEEVANDIEQDAEDHEHEKVMQAAFERAKKVPINQQYKKKVGKVTLTIDKYEPKKAFEKDHQFNYGSFRYPNELPNEKAIVSMYKPIEPSSYICQDPDVSTTVVEISTASVSNDGTMKYISVPVLINFDSLTKPNIKETKASVTLPSNKNDWDFDVLMNNITVHRLDVYEGHEVFIEFSELDKDTKLKVAVTHNLRPNISHFQNGFVVDESDNSTWNIYPRVDTFDGNCWVYMAILIHDDMLQNSNSSFITLEYSVKFSSKSCVIWNKQEREWETQGCRLKASNDSSITCACKHTSIFAGMESNVESKLDPIILMRDAMEVTICRIIFYFVASVVGLYCISICFSLKRTTARACKDNIFFLADNLKNELYCYIIIVKTGNVRNAGTTSNIMIRLHGINHDSKEHVLNYPDPDKQLLQRDSEQWYVLTADQYLGEVNEIDVWFDSIGYRPTWNCDNIRVIDMQKQESYYFDVKQWLDVLDDCVKFTVKSSAENIFEDWNKKLWRNFKFHVGGGHTWNIFSRAYDEALSYIQRITCILSQILNVYVFTVLMYGSPELRMRDGLTLGLFRQVTICAIGFLSGFLSFVINTTIVVIFRHSNSSSDVFNMVMEQKLLPPWTDTLAWGLLLGNVHLSLIYLVTFGFWLPKVESIQWIVSTTIGILVNIFVFESLYLSLEEIFLKMYSRTHPILFKREYLFDNIMHEVENQRKFLYNRFGEYLLRPYLRNLYKTLPDEIVASKKTWNRLKHNVSSLFKDFMLFLFYFFLIYLLVFSERMSVLYDSNQRMGRIVSGELGLEYDLYKLEDIRNYNDIYDYIEFTVIPALHGRFWYGNWEIHNAGTMADISNKVIGIAQIRQQRKDFGPCKIVAWPCCKDSKPLCHSDYVSTSNHSRKGVFRKSVWLYKTAKETGLPSVAGTLRRYDGGGFIARLGRTMRNSMYVLEYLKQRHWIDISSKVVIIDFWAYNANYNLFHVVEIVIERSSTAYILARYKVFTSHLLIVGDVQTELRSGIVVLLLFGTIIAILMRQIESIIKMRKHYFKMFWNYYDWGLIGMTIFTIGLHIERNQMAERVLEKLASKDNNDFVLYFHLVRTSQSLILLSALLVCLVTLRIWKYLRFWTIFRTLERTLLKAASPLLINTGYFFLIILAYSSAGCLIFGAFHPDMHTFFKISATLFIMSLGFDNIDSAPELLNHYIGYLGQIYKVSFMIISLLMVNIITTIIIIYLEESKQYFSNVRDPYTIFDYVKEEFRYYKELIVNRTINMRLRGGGNTDQEDLLLDIGEPLRPQAEKVYAKSPEHRYADSEKVTRSKISSMAVISTAVIQRKLLRRGPKLKRKDYKTMAAVVLELSKKTIIPAVDVKKDKELLFFMQKTPDDHVELVCDYRLLQMEYVVRRLVDENCEIKVERVVHKAAPDALKFVKIHNNLKSLLDCVAKFKFTK